MNFVKINNEIFNEVEKNSGVTKIGIIGCNGFVLYTYLLSLRGTSGQATTSIKAIKEFMNGVRGFKTNSTICKMLEMLNRMGLIEIRNVDGYDNIKLNKSLLVEIKDFDFYEKMPIKLMIDKLSKIGTIGFTILCLLVKLHNVNDGYANPSQLYIANIIGIDKTAVIKYIKILEKEKLINVKTEDVFVYEDEYGLPLINRTNNKYKVNYLKKNNKYYTPKQ
ncbi:MAG: helix-turn-helix domain-containing protein [Clostridium sp.]